MTPTILLLQVLARYGVKVVRVGTIERNDIGDLVFEGWTVSADTVLEAAVAFKDASLIVDKAFPGEATAQPN
jgi:hypothetical protein